MPSDFHVVSIDFDTPELTDWHPSDPFDCEVWATVAVGGDQGTSLYQLHICTPAAMRSFADKRYVFTIDEFRGVAELVAKLNAFIEGKIAKKPGDPFGLLANHWLWEYAKM